MQIALSDGLLEQVLTYRLASELIGCIAALVPDACTIAYFDPGLTRLNGDDAFRDRT